MDKNHKDPDVIDLSVPRRAQYLHKSWKRHQDAVHWVDMNLAMKKGLKFCQTRSSNAIILQETLPAYCIPQVVRMETEEVIYEKVYMSPRPPPKISLKHEWKREVGSEHAQRPEVGQLSRSFQSNQPIPNPSRERTRRHVVKDDTRTVKRTSPDTENHEQNGYAKVYDDNNIIKTNVDNDNSDTTCTDMHNHLSHPHWLKSSLSPSFHLHTIHDERFSLSCSTSPFTSTCTSPSFSCPSSPCTPTTLTP